MQLIQGFISVFDPVTLALIVGGVVGGIVFGAIPGLSAFTALALFLPMTFTMEPVNGISFLIAIYVGGLSGGLISAVLLGIPGTPSSIATCFDGYPMARNGEAGKALGTAIDKWNHHVVVPVDGSRFPEIVDEILGVLESDSDGGENNGEFGVRSPYLRLSGDLHGKL